MPAGIPVTAIHRLQAAMAALPQVELETSHFWCEGMYARLLPRPAGTLIVGKQHRKPHFYIIMSGTVAVTDGTEAPKQISAPAVLVSEPGVKRAVYALTDAVCMTVHRTELTDLDEIEAELVEPDEGALFDSKNKPLSLEPA